MRYKRSRGDFQPSPNDAMLLLSYLPARPDYDTWIKTISAIGNTFDTTTALNLLSSKFREEKRGELEYKLNQRLQNINYGTLVYYAKQYGYIPDKSHRNDRHDVFKARPNKQHQKKVYEIPKETNFIYRYKDYEVEERYCIYEYEGNLSDIEATNEISKLHPDAEKERIFRIAINRKILDKNLSRKTKEPLREFNSLTNYFENCTLSADEIIFELGNGHAFSCAHFNSESQYCKRKNDNVKHSELLAIDIDGTLNIDEAFEIEFTKKALILYTTPSHTKEEHRFRIIFALPFLCNNLELYSKLAERFIKIYEADEQCKDPSRAFYGNSNGTYYNIQAGEIIKFEGGNYAS